MLKRLSDQNIYCFLDGYSGYNQIPINLEDQEKTAFTFQWSMLSIFSDLIEKSIEVFIDDFSIFGPSFVYVCLILTLY